MHPLLSGRATVNPPSLINMNSAFGAIESDSASSYLEPPANEDSSIRRSGSAENDGDPFVPVSAHRAKKRRKVNDTASEAMKDMLDMFQVKWTDQKEAEATIREEEKEDRERMLDVMTKGQQSMSDAVDVLRSIAQKM